MLYVFLMTSLLACSYSGAFRPFDDIINDVVRDVDLNNDTLISLVEFEKEVLEKWTGGQKSVNKADFVLLWTSTYGDDPVATGQFFDNMDRLQPRGVLDEFDILWQFPQLDTNFNGDISTAEFIAFLRLKHPNGNAQTN